MAVSLILSRRSALGMNHGEVSKQNDKPHQRRRHKKRRPPLRAPVDDHEDEGDERPQSTWQPLGTADGSRTISAADLLRPGASLPSTCFTPT